MSCSITGCPAKATIMLVCSLKNGLYDDVELMKDFSGYVVLQAFNGDHKTTTPNKVKLMPAF